MENRQKINVENLTRNKSNQELIRQFREFNRLMMWYRSAIREVTTKRIKKTIEQYESRD